MNQTRVRALDHGLYRVYWTREAGGGMSLAAVGSTEAGDRWLAPTNWVGLGVLGDRSTWDMVDRVELVASLRRPAPDDFAP